MSADVLVQYQPGDTVGLVAPVSPASKSWIEEHVQPDAPRMGHALVVEHRYVRDLLTGMVGDGLTLGAL
jgi:hypothetical protein